MKLNYALFFEENELTALRNRYRNERFFSPLREEIDSIDRPGMRRFLSDEVNLRDPLQDLPKVTDLAEKMAFCFLMDGDDDAAELAKEAIRALMRFPVWDFFLSQGQVVGVQRASAATVGVALVCDWLGDALDPAERGDWIDAMGRKGCEPCYHGLHEIRFPRKAGIWTYNEATTFFEIRPGENSSMVRRPEITQRTNLRAVPASALAFGALAWRAEHGESPEVERWLEMSGHAIRAFGEIYEEDGSYDEAINYANYTTLHIIQALELFRRAAVADLSRLINWSGYARFCLNMTMPLRDNLKSVVNFGDSGNFSPLSGGQRQEKVVEYRAAVCCWIAREKKDSKAQWFARNRGGQPDVWALLWYDPTVDEEAPVPGFHVWRNDLDWVVARTDWEASGQVVALRSGPPANHEHADRNSIIVKAHGEVLVADPLRPPYSYSDPCWMMRLTEGHSAVLIDGKGHGYHNGVEGTCPSPAKARIIHEQKWEDGYIVVSDGTQPYRLVDTSIREVIRALCFLPGAGVLVVVDSLKRYAGRSTLEARYFGYNPDAGCMIATVADGFRIERPQAFLEGKVFSSAPITVVRQQLPIPEEEAADHPFVAVTTDTQSEVLLVSVLSMHPTGSEGSLPIRCSVKGLNLSLEVAGITLESDAARLRVKA